MPKKERPDNPFTSFPNRLLFKVAGMVAAIIAVCAFVLMVWLFNQPAETAAIFSILLFIIIFIAVYAVVKIMIIKRLTTISRIADNIAHKRFEDYRIQAHKNNDELDRLIRQCRIASKTMEREIERLNKIENYRKEFIGDISHELKTPIFAIQGFIETLLDGAIDDNKVNRDFLEKALKNANRLTYLTKDLMEISKLETGELTSNKEDIKPATIINEVVESLQYKAEEEGVLIQSKNIDSPLTVKADRRQLRQVLLNLIENAIKYNKIGGLVTVSAKAYPENDDKILMSVEDNGIGIEPRYLERITERFFRIDKSRSRKKGGTGLGLAIVKHIIEAHDEKFFVKSTPGEGSKFSFTLQRVKGIRE